MGVIESDRATINSDSNDDDDDGVDNEDSSEDVEKRVPVQVNTGEANTEKPQQVVDPRGQSQNRGQLQTAADNKPNVADKSQSKTHKMICAARVIHLRVVHAYPFTG